MSVASLDGVGTGKGLVFTAKGLMLSSSGLSLPDPDAPEAGWAPPTADVECWPPGVGFEPSVVADDPEMAEGPPEAAPVKIYKYIKYFAPKTPIF